MKKTLLIGLSSIAILLLGLYVGMTIYFNGHYFPNTYIGTIPSAGKTPEDVISKKKSIANDYLLTITDRKDNKFQVRGMDISYEYVPRGEEEQILEKQNPFAWPVHLRKKHTYELSKSINYDDNALRGILENLEIFSEDYISPPTDAYILLEDGKYELVPETLGNTPIFDQIYKETTDALSNETELIALSDECYESPDIYSDNDSLTKTAKKIESYSNSEIHYEIDGVDENLTSTDILKMLALDEEGCVYINKAKVQGFVQHLASTYNTYGDVRKFKTTKGDKIKIGGGDYGWVINKTKEEEQIIKDLEGGEPVSREPVYEQRAIKSGLDDIGDTYVEIDYTAQHLWYYKDGKLELDTDIVSGSLRTHNGSVDGVYKIVYKQRNATLVGEGYSTPVKYFMPYAYNIGFHDAGWRSSFGDEIYKTSGSHGCINIPPKMAKKLYEKIENGTPVIAYYREKVELTNTAAQVSNAYSYVEKKDKH